MVLSAEPYRLTSRRAWPAPLTIGVVSDTHVYPNGARRLPPEVIELFQRFAVGLIVHGGDVNCAPVLRQLEALAPLLAVVGNNDDAELRAALPAELTFAVGGFRFGVLHGHGGRSARTEAKARFAGKVDCVIYGHSHIPKIEEVKGTICFNPGSATDRRWEEHFGVGLIHVTDEKITPELVLYSDPRHLANVKPE